MYSAQGQFERAKFWRAVNLSLGVAAAILAAVAGVVGLASDSARILSGVLALIAAGMVSVLTTVNADRRHSQAAAAANAYLEIQTAARQLHAVDLPRLDYDTARDGYPTVRLELGYIEHAPVADRSADVVISNGVINLCDDKTAVFREIARMLKPGGRTAISDIVTERQLTDAIICDVNLWASCIGGAMQQDDYRRAIEDAGLEIHKLQQNPQYRFISDSAQGATKTFGVKSISVLAAKPG